LENRNDDFFTMIRQASEIERLYIDFDCFFASVEQQLQPHLRQRPVGVLPFMSKASCIIAPSREAKAYAVKTGMRVKEALKLCPDLLFTPARHDIYVQLHHKIYQCIESCVHIDQACSIDEVVCTLLGRERKNLETLAHRIRKILNNEIGTYISCSMGFAPNRLLAKIASDFKKPEGTVIWHPQQYAKQLFTLELRDLPGIGQSMGRRLEIANIHSVEKLYSMTAENMRTIWGSIEGERFWYSLHGYAIEPRPTSRCMFGHSRILTPENRNPRHARNCARLLTVKAARRLRRDERTASAFGLTLRFENKLKWFGEEHFAFATDDHTFLTALTKLWTSAMQCHSNNKNKYPYRIKQVSIAIYHLNKSEHAQGDLFSNHEQSQQKQEKWNNLTQTMDEIVKKYGNKAASLGVWEDPPGGYAGAKIAFGRIPNLSDF
jgi:DNA polymerase IV